MSGPPPPPAPRRAAVVLVALLSIVMAFGAAVPAAATSAGVTDDPVNETTPTVTGTTDDVTTAVDDTTSTSTDGVTTAVDDTTSTTTDATDDATGSTTRTPDETAATGSETALLAEVEETTGLGSGPVADLTRALDATVDGTTEPLPNAPTVTEASALDGAVLESTADAAAGSAERPAGAEATSARTTPRPALRDADGSSAGGDGAGVPVPPSAAGAAAVGGLVAGVATLRHGLGFASTSSQPRPGDLRRAARATAGRARARWPDWLPRLGALAGYQRFADDDPLEHGTRAALFEVIEGADGASLDELSRETDVPVSTLRYHLRVLEHESLVTSTKHRGRRLYVPAGEEPSALRAALKEDGAAAVLETLAADGPDSVSGLAEALGRDVSTVTHHLQRLEADGLVVRERDGQAVVNRLEPAVRAALTAGSDAPTPAVTGLAEARSD